MISLIIFVAFILLIIVIINKNNEIKDLKSKISKLEKENLNYTNEVFESNKQNITSKISKNETINVSSEKINQSRMIQCKVCHKLVPYNEHGTCDECHEIITKRLKEKEIENEKKKNIDEEKMQKNTSKDTNNSLMLVSGAVLIILSAIVFLVSTWGIIGNLMKTTILIVMAGVFFYSSKIADKKFGLKKVSNVFFYISMAYIPIVVISISFFKLFGNYLSMFGEGKFVYFTISFSLLSIFYFFIERYYKKDAMLILSMLSQLTTLIMFALIFDKNISFIILLLNIYSLILMLISKSKLLNENENFIFDLVSKIYLYVFSFEILLMNLLKNRIEVLNLINAIILTLNYYIRSHKEKNIFNKIMYNVALMTSVFSFVKLDVLDYSLNQKIIIMLSASILNFLYGNLKTRITELKDITSIITVFIMSILYIVTCIYEECYIKNYGIILIFIAEILISYFKNTTFKKIIEVILPLEIFILVYNVIGAFSLDMYILVVLAIAFLIVSTMPKMKKFFFELFGNIGLAISLLNTCIDDPELYIKTLWLHVLIFVTYLFMNLVSKNKSFYKLIGYFWTNIVLLSIFKIFNYSQYLYIPLISTNMLALAETFKNIVTKKKEVSALIYLFVLYIITGITLLFDSSTCGFFFGFINVGIYFICAKLNNELDDKVKYVGFALMMLNLYIPRNAVDRKALVIYGINIVFVLCSAITAIATFLSIKDKKITPYVIISFVYLIATWLKFKFNMYILLSLMCIWCVLHLVFVNKYKSVFKTGIYLNLLIIYNKLIRDLGLQKYTLIKLFGYMCFLFLLLKNILKSKMNKNDFKTLEYLLCSLIYAWALGEYSNEIDGMVFVGFLVGISKIAYDKKYGPVFLTSIIAILVNAFLLTREFWFAVPWWIYLLVIGLILIAFAVNNEANMKKRNDVKNKIIKLKDKIDF